jgi:16S rRNA (guanine(966)-N(2))-methyltransferase RsmD
MTTGGRLVRIIAGSRKGRVLEGPRGEGLRPTADRVRQAIFDILGQWLDGLSVLDLFAGTGAFGLEALSRGAARAVLVDHGRESLALCRHNTAALGLSESCEIVAASFGAGTLRELGAKGPFDLVFADPPYGAFSPDEVLVSVGDANLLSVSGRLIVEHDKREEAPRAHAGLRLETSRRFGNTAVSFYVNAAGPHEGA